MADLVARGAGRVSYVPEAEVAAAVAAVLAILGDAGRRGEAGPARATVTAPGERAVPAGGTAGGGTTGAGDAGGTAFRLWSLAGRQQQMGARLHALRAARRSRGGTDG